MLRPIALATALAGTLDILLAIGLTLARGKAVGDMLRFVASGPFPSAATMGVGGAVLGLVVHFLLMAIMVAAFVLAARAFPFLLDRPLLWGALYGLATYVALDLIVVPTRFGLPLAPPPVAIATQLFAHVVLVGMLTAWIARQHLQPVRG